MHTKRLAVGYGKEKKWVTTPNPGPHAREESIPLLIVVRDMIGYADNASEAKKIIEDGLVTVDKKVRRDHKYGVGLMDVIDVPKIKKHYRVMPTEKGLAVKEIDEKESSLKPCKITGKRLTSGGKIQLTLHDGSSLVTDKKDYRVNDTLLLELPKRKIAGDIKYEKGNIALIVRGRHSGSSGKIKDIVLATATRKSTTAIEDMHTLTSYSFIVGADKPSIKI